MKIRAGYTISYDCPQPTPMILQLSVHPSRIPDLLSRDRVQFDPPIPANTYHDSFGNFCHVITAPTGRLTMSTDFSVQDSGEPDVVAPQAEQHALQVLPVEALIFLLGSRYCETDRLMNTAWSLFGHLPKGWSLVQAICDYVHGRIRFDYAAANPRRTASDGFREGVGVCRDFAHLAAALCRAMNVPARYCTGYLGDIGVPPDPAPMDFSAWFEVFLTGRWYTFDARHNAPRIGRIVMARGRDAADVAISTAFGQPVLKRFEVTTYEEPIAA